MHNFNTPRDDICSWSIMDESGVSCNLAASNFGSPQLAFRRGVNDLANVSVSMTKSKEKRIKQFKQSEDNNNRCRQRGRNLLARHLFSRHSRLEVAENPGIILA
jgi:hypothetical protein